MLHINLLYSFMQNVINDKIGEDDIRILLSSWTEIIQTQNEYSNGEGEKHRERGSRRIINSHA